LIGTPLDGTPAGVMLVIAVVESSKIVWASDVAKCRMPDVPADTGFAEAK
jgi:hypothetical protein